MKNPPAVMPSLKPILLCADDFGMSRQIDAGIIELAGAGRLSAVSCLVDGPLFRQDAPQLASLPVGRGLHLNLTEPFAAAEFCQPLSLLIWNCYARQSDADRIGSEIVRQLDLFEDQFRQRPDYIDGHQHVHQLPVVRECLIRIVESRYPEPRPWLRSTCRPRGKTLPHGTRTKAAIIESLGARALKALAARHAVATNPHLLGVYGFAGGEDNYRDLLDSWIESAGPGGLIMCHPARGVDPADGFGAQRCAELAVLSGAELTSLLERHHAVVARYARV